MSDRVQLNLRLDGQRELLDAAKQASENEGKSLNQWVIDLIKVGLGIPPEERLDNLLAEQLENKLVDKVDKIVDQKIDARLDFALLEVREILTAHINSTIHVAFEEKFLDLSGRIVVLVNQVVEQRYRDRPSITQIAQEAGRELRNSPELVTISIEPKGLSQRKLADRLGVDSETVARHRVKSDFEQWSSQLDPENFRWWYNADAKKFFAVD